MSGKKLFKALGATIVSLVVVVALANPKFFDAFKGALILFLEGEPNITYDHESLDEASDFDNITPDYVAALEEAGIDLPEDELLDANVTIFKAKDGIDVPANAPYKLSVEAAKFDEGSNLIEVAAALVDSRLIDPERITGECEDTSPRHIPEECGPDLLSLAAGVDLVRYFNLRNNANQNSYDILLPPLGIYTGGTKSLVSSEPDTGEDTTEPVSALTTTSLQASVPQDFTTGGTDVGYLDQNFGINRDGSVPRSLIVVSTNTPFTNELLDKVKFVSPLFSYDVEGFAEFEEDSVAKFSSKDLKVVRGETTEFSFVTNLDTVDVRFTPVSKVEEVIGTSSMALGDEDIAGAEILEELTADADGTVTLSWDGNCNYDISGKTVEECDLEKHNYVYIDFIDEKDDVFSTYVIELEFGTENGSIVDIESPTTNGNFQRLDGGLVGHKVDEIYTDSYDFTFESNTEITSYTFQKVWSDAASYPADIVDHAIDFDETFSSDTGYLYTEPVTVDLESGATSFEHTLNSACDFTHNSEGEVTPAEDDCIGSYNRYLFVSVEKADDTIHDFYFRVEFAEEYDDNIDPKDSIAGHIQRMLGRIMKSLRTNTLASENFEVIIQIIPINFVEETLPDEVVVSGEDLITSDDLFESIKAKTYFEDRVEVQDLKFEPGYESTIGQGYGGLYDYMVEHCEDEDINTELQNLCRNDDFTREHAIEMGASVLEGFGLDFEIYKLHSSQETLKIHREQINHLSFETNDGYREYYAIVLGNDFGDLINIGTDIIIQFFALLDLDLSILFDFVHNVGFAGFGFTNGNMTPGHLMLQDGVANNAPDRFNSIADFATFNDKTRGGTLIIMALDRQLLDPTRNVQENIDDVVGDDDSTEGSASFFAYPDVGTYYIHNLATIDEDSIYINFHTMPSGDGENLYQVRIVDDSKNVVSETIEIAGEFVEHLNGEGSIMNTFLNLTEPNTFVPGVEYTLELLHNSEIRDEIHFLGYNPLIGIVDNVELDRDELVVDFNSSLNLGNYREISFKYSIDGGEFTAPILSGGWIREYIDIYELEAGTRTFTIQYCDSSMGCYEDGGEFYGHIEDEIEFEVQERIEFNPRFYVIPLEFIDPEVPVDFFARLDQPELDKESASRDDEKVIITDIPVEVDKGEELDFAFSSNAENLNYTLNIHAKSNAVSTQEFLDTYRTPAEGEIIKRGPNVVSENNLANPDGRIEFTWDGQCNYNFSAIGLNDGSMSGGLTEIIEEECDEELTHYLEVRIEDSSDPGENVVAYFFPIIFSGDEFRAELVEPAFDDFVESGAPYGYIITETKLIIEKNTPVSFEIDTNAERLDYGLSTVARSSIESTMGSAQNLEPIPDETMKVGLYVINEVNQGVVDDKVSFVWNGMCNYSTVSVGNTTDAGVVTTNLETPEVECDDSMNQFISIDLKNTDTEERISYLIPFEFTEEEVEPVIACSLSGDLAGPYNPVENALRLTAFTTIDDEVVDSGLYRHDLEIYQGDERIYNFGLTTGEFDGLWFHTVDNVDNADEIADRNIDSFLPPGDYQARYDTRIIRAIASGDASICDGPLIHDFSVGEPVLPDEEDEDEDEVSCPVVEFPTFAKGDDYDVYEASYNEALATLESETPEGLECEAPRKVNKPSSGGSSGGGGGTRGSASTGFCGGSEFYFDVEETNPLFPAVEFATSIGFKGKPDAKCAPKRLFDLNAKFNRVEYAKIASLLVAQYQDIDLDVTAITWSAEDGPMYSDTNFADAAQAWQANHIKRATQIGIFRGYLGEKDPKTGLVPFKAPNEISYAEFIKVSFIALGLGDAAEFNKKQSPWYGEVMKAAEEAGLPSYKQFRYAPTKTLSRGDAVKILFEIKELGLWPDRVRTVSFDD